MLIVNEFISLKLSFHLKYIFLFYMMLFKNFKIDLFGVNYCSNS